MNIFQLNDSKKKNYVWREEMKGMEDKWISLNEKGSKTTREDENMNPKYIDDYNKTVENLLTQIKSDRKLADITPVPKNKIFSEMDMMDIEKDVRKLQEKNNLRRSLITEKYEKDMNGTKSIKIEIKPKYSDYTTLEKKQKLIVPDESKPVRKGAWRKDMARYEEDLELSKLRKETKKKITSLNDENLAYEEMKGKSIPVTVIKRPVDKDTFDGKTKFLECQKTVLVKSKSEIQEEAATRVTIRLSNKSEEKIDASLTIKPCKPELSKDIFNSETNHVKNIPSDKISVKNGITDNSKLTQPYLDKMEEETSVDKKEKSLVPSTTTQKESLKKEKRNEVATSLKKEEEKSQKEKKSAKLSEDVIVSPKKVKSSTNEQKNNIQSLKSVEKPTVPMQMKEPEKIIKSIISNDLKEISVDENKAPEKKNITKVSNHHGREGSDVCEKINNESSNVEGQVHGVVNGEEENEDEDGMKAMRKETNDAFANMEAEFEAGRTKLAALRARIRKAREMSKVTIDE